MTEGSGIYEIHPLTAPSSLSHIAEYNAAKRTQNEGYKREREATSQRMLVWRAQYSTMRERASLHRQE